MKTRAPNGIQADRCSSAAGSDDHLRLERRLLRETGRAIGDFRLIEPGDRILVGLSGGKDSYTLLVLLQLLQQRAPVPFEIEAANLDPGFEGFRADVVADFARQRQIPMREGRISCEKRCW